MGPVSYDTEDFIDYLGVQAKTLPYIGRDGYPQVTLEIGASDAAGDATLGLTLYQTAAIDENGQKLLYYPQKALETQSVLPGQSVPVLSRGIVTLHAQGYKDGAEVGNNGIPALDLRAEAPASTNPEEYTTMVGSGVLVTKDTTNDVQLRVCSPTEVGSFGTVIAVGSRVSPTGAANIGVNKDLYAGGGGGNAGVGLYAVVKFDTSSRIVK